MKKFTLILVLATMFLLTACEEIPTKSLNTEPELFTAVEEQDLSTAEEKEESLPQDSIGNSEENVRTMALADSGPANTKTLPSNKKEMSIEEIILKYKKILNISDDYDEVSTEESQEMSGDKYYTVNYNNTKTDESLWFSADIYGNLRNYSSYSETNNKKENNLSSAEAIEIVKSILYELYGDVSKDFIITKDPSMNNLSWNQSYYTVTRTVNKVKVPTDTLSIEISKSSKNIVYLNVNTASNYDFSDTSNFEDLEGIVDQDQGFQAFKKANKIYPLQLKISDMDSYYLYNKYSLKAALGFIEKQIPVSAKDLKAYYRDPYRPMGLGSEDKLESNEAMAEAGLSPVEQEHLDSVNNQHSLEDAEQKARSLFPLKDYKLSYSNFSPYNGIKGYNKWSLTFNKDDSYIYVSILANDLSLISYSNYEEGRKEDLDPISYLNLANDFVVSKAGMDPSKMTISERSKNDQGDDYHLVEYFRNLEDGQILFNDKVSVNINKKNGKVQYFDKQWTFDLKDVEKDLAVSEEEAYEKLNDAFGFQLVYLRDLVDQEELFRAYYALNTNKLDYSGIYLVDGQSGQIIDLYGKEILTDELVEYSDIEETKHPDIIRTLLENNIGFSGGVLDRTKAVSQEEMFRILLADDFQSDPLSISQEDLYKRVKERKLLNGEEANPDKIIRNRDYARYVSRYLSYFDDIARNNQIFKDAYKDIDSSDPDYGYLVLGKLKKTMEFSSDNLLEPDKEVDRETFLYYYYYLKANN
ncbi:MAG: hypothetical protein Q4E36_04320 [Bacillota bacterium]|nr:hypothetical protein [Bacillota bacterium]